MAQGTSSGTSSRRHGRNEHDTSSISSSRYADAEWEAKEVMRILRLIMDFSDVLSVTPRSEIPHNVREVDKTVLNGQFPFCGFVAFLPSFLQSPVFSVRRYSYFWDATSYTLVDGTDLSEKLLVPTKE